MKSRVWIGLALTMILIATGVFIWRKLAAPANGVITKVDISSNQKHNYGSKSYVGKQVSFNCDERYSLNSSYDASVQVDSFVFNFTGKSYKHLAVAVDSLPAGGLGEYPAYQTRVQHTDQYTQSQQTVAGASYAVFAAIDGSQRTALGARGSQVVSVALTSGTNDATLEVELNQILASLHWR